MRAHEKGPESEISRKTQHTKTQILRLTTPNLHPANEDLFMGARKLKSVWGSVRLE